MVLGRREGTLKADSWRYGPIELWVVYVMQYTFAYRRVEECMLQSSSKLSGKQLTIRCTYGALYRGVRKYELFRDLRKCCWTGLTPAIISSMEHLLHGGIVT